MLRALSASGTIPRGLGRSYNDAAQLSGGSFIDTTIWNHVLQFDPSTGILEVEAGASFDQLMREFMVQGFFVPVTPGTRYVTVGGAIACDVHGKNHHRDGSFTDHVTSFDLATPGGVITVTRETEPQLFNATCGGMGLTGIILRAKLKLISVESTYMRVDTVRTKNLDQVMDLMENGDQEYRYSVAWVDSLAKGSSLGRAVLTRGDHAKLSELSGSSLHSPLEFKPKTRLSAPGLFPPGVLNALIVKAFNQAWYQKAPKIETTTIEHASAFFHPLDGVGSWNRIYGPRGFIQYQYVVPFGQEDTVRGSLKLLSTHHAGSFLTVLKRFGRGNEGLLSFPMEGWTLALDLPVGPRGLPRLLDTLDEMIIGAGGKVYLAKDSRVSKQHLKEMYPKLAQFKEIINKIDPERILQSDLSKRLGI